MNTLKRLLFPLSFMIVVLSGYSQQDISAYSWKKIATGMPERWYAGNQAAMIAENVLSYQTEAGGWPKNTNFHKETNMEDEDRGKRIISGATFDNGATVTEMRFLARMYRNRKDKRYRAAFLTAFEYILDAQYDNGGWPQYYPVRSGKSVAYSGCITFNDNAYINVMYILRDIFSESMEFSALELEDSIIHKARQSFDKGIRCILDTQIKVNGERTVWCAQHNQYTLKPSGARSYELPSFSGGESAGIVMLLMSVTEPSDEIIASVKGAVKWFEKHKIPDVRYERYRDASGEKDSRLVSSPGNNVWARFYDLETGKPFFCDRDGIKKSSPDEIGKERRGGYSWYVTSPSKVLKHYPEWLKRNGITI